MADTSDLAALVGSRICHDLISPLGAIGNGVELLGMSGSTAGPELALIAESVATANARIRFYRVAFGSASKNQSMGRSEVLSILSDLTRGARLSVDWQVTTEQPRAETKLAFLLIQCLESALPFGGIVEIRNQGGGWNITGSAPRMKVDPVLWDGLTNPAAPPSEASAAQVQFLLAPLAARSCGRTLRCAVERDRITIDF